MFETDTKPGWFVSILPRLVSYFLQLLFSYPVVGFASSAVISVLAAAGLSGQHPRGVYFAGYDILVYALIVGPLIGWGIGLLAPELAATGRWIWVPPSALWTLMSLEEQHLSHQFLPESFFAYSGNEGIGVYLFSLPTFAAVGYSIGMTLASYREWLLKSSPFVLRLGVISLSFITAFAALAVFMSRFEDLRLFEANTHAYVVNRSTVLLTANPEALCRGQALGSVTIAKGDMVDSGDQRACNGNVLLEPEANQPPDSFLIERVKVKSGPNIGSEGWVPSAALAIQARE